MSKGIVKQYVYSKGEAAKDEFSGIRINMEKLYSQWPGFISPTYRCSDYVLNGIRESRFVKAREIDESAASFKLVAIS